MNTKTTDYKIAFFGTPDLTLPYLESLSKSGFTPSLIVSNPDRKVGRGNNRGLSIPTPKQWALDHNVDVLQPEKITPEVVEELQNMGPWDLFIVVAYGQILPQELLDIPEHGALNIHYSLLPRWRGASPVEAAILAGDSETGVAIQKMVYELDAGDIVAWHRVSLIGNEFAHMMKTELSGIGARLLVDTLPAWFAGEITPTPQDESAGITKCYKTKKNDGQIDLSEINDEQLWRRYRAYYPWPGLFYFDGDGKRVKISKASFNEDENRFVIEKITPEGKPEQNFM